MTAQSAPPARPAAVEAFAEAIADWLSSFTVPQELAAEMASACAEGSPWAAAVAGTAARRAGWPEREALAWGIALGALAGALEAGRRSLADGPPENGRAADGPALPLLAADGLIAAAHETLGSLDPDRLVAAMDALRDGFGDGGPWRTLHPGWPRPAWPAVVAIGLGPAAAADPEGPWTELVEAWRGAYAAPPNGGPSTVDGHSTTGGDAALSDHPDDDARRLLVAATAAARGEEGDGAGF